ncbi:MAG: M81 family metallopeptidase [Alphaproteobacteria bacterium]|nr:M81 family metallopeptidase [Alphaproteobacteria bacterium]
MRIAIAQFMQETNSFVPFTTTVKTFEEQYLHRGEELFTAFGKARLEIPGAIAALKEVGAEIVPLIATMAMASGTVERASFEILLGEILERLRTAGPVDGVYLALHGAMILEDEPDAEAEIVRRVREVLKPGTPITVSLDLHGHITAAMLQPDVAYIGYREFPHIDMYETGYRAAALLVDWVKGKVRPVMALAKRHMVVSPDSARTTAPPLADIVAEGRAMEARKMEDGGDVLHVSLFPVQPWIDTPDLGFAALVCAQSHEAAQKAADTLARMAWDRRTEFEPTLTPLPEIIRTALSSEGLTVASDSGDTPSGGGAADSTAVLAALLKEGADRADRISICTICDAEAAAEAARAGVGKTITLKVGHRRSGLGEPLTVTGRVKTIGDGRYVLTGPGANGMVGEMGLTVVLEIGSIRLNLRSIPHFEWDPGIHTSVGLDPASAALVFVRSPAHFRASYAPMAARIFIADTPGPTSANMRRIPFTKVTRPLYPIDLVND